MTLNNIEAAASEQPDRRRNIAASRHAIAMCGERRHEANRRRRARENRPVRTRGGFEADVRRTAARSGVERFTRPARREILRLAVFLWSTPC